MSETSSMAGAHGGSSTGLFGGQDVLMMLRRNTLFIILVALIGTGATWVWLVSKPAVFSAGAAILLVEQEMPSEAGSSADGGGVTPTWVFTEIEVMRSREFATRLANRMDLMADPRFNPALVEYAPPGPLEEVMLRLGLSRERDWRGAPAAEQQEAVVSKLQSLYFVSGSAQHSVVEISARHSDPGLAAEIANGVASLYIDETVAEERAHLDRTVGFLRARSDTLATLLSRQQVDMASLIQDNRLRDDDFVRRLLAELETLQNRLETLPDGAPTRGETHDRVSEINRILNRRVGAELKLIQQDLALQKDLTRYANVSQRLSELEAQRDAAKPNARQISVAEVPVVPFGPNIRSSLALSVVVFTAAGMVLALVKENLDRRVNGYRQAELSTGLPIIGTLPQIPRSILRKYGSPHQCMAKQAFPPFSHAVQSLVTAVYRAAGDDRAPVVFVGSAVPNEGKSSTATSMAVAAAQDDLRVLVIDFDVHRRGATRALQAQPGKHKISEIMSDPSTLYRALQKTPFSGVDILNFKPGSNFSRRVLRTKTATTVLDRLRTDYDLIIFDTPPYLVSEESNRLEGIIDGAILISRWRSDRDVLTQTAMRMRQNELKVIGVAINGIPVKKAKLYGYTAAYEGYAYTWSGDADVA